MAKDPAFSFYAQDFIVDTVQWTRAAKGLHCELLAIAWINGYIEADETGCPVELDEDGLQLWKSRVSKKWVLHNGRLFNERLEETRDARKKFKDNQSAKGKKSAELRATERQPIINHGSTTVQPVIPVEPLEREYEEENKDEIGDQKFLVPQMITRFKLANSSDPEDRERDGPALLSIAKFLCQRGNLRGAPEHNVQPVLEAWDSLAGVIAADRFYCQKSLSTISSHIQEIIQKALHGDKSKPSEKSKSGSLDDEKLKAAIRKRTG
jgi:hypothetical protein